VKRYEDKKKNVLKEECESDKVKQKKGEKGEKLDAV